MNSTEKAQNNLASKGIKPYWLVFFTVSFLVIIAGMFFYWALHSEGFASFAIDYLIAQAAPETLRIEVGKVNGTIASGIIINNVRIRQPSKQFDTKINYAHLTFFVSDLLRSGTISVEARITSVEASGLLLPDWPDSMPAFSAFSCLGALPANLKIKSLLIEKLILRPHPLMLIEFSETDLLEASESDQQPLKFVFECSYKERPIGQGRFDGVLVLDHRKVEGTLDLELAQQNFSCELSLRERRRQTEISGFIATATMDITVLSRWLSPLWQDDFPFGFDGNLNFSGSWLYNNEVGLVGNIAGEFNKLRMVALGLFIPIFELNANWRFFDGNIAFEDTGSFFIYFPATISGSVDSVLSGKPRWDVTFASTAIDFAEFVAQLPWSARFGLSLPELAGKAEFFLSLKSIRPEVKLFISTDSLKAGKGLESRQISGAINYVLPGSGLGEYTFDFNVASEHQLPPYFQKFSDFEHLGGQGPFIFSYSARGPDFGNFAYKGLVKRNDEAFIRSNGVWEEGFGHARAVYQDSDRTFAADDIKTLDLILAN